LYDLLVPALRAGARVGAWIDPKLRTGLHGRRGGQARWHAIVARHRGTWIWMHAASVGEYEQARPVAARLRRQHPEIAVLHTFFSPSGFEYARRLGEAEHCAYLPEDARGEVGAALDAMRPAALVLLKFDVWPNLVIEAERRGIPVLLLDATLQPRSWRSRWPARMLYRAVYERIAVISAVTAADAARFRALVPQHSCITVDGDTRYDQVQRRREAARRVPIAPLLTADPRPFTLIAGSTWRPDEARLLEAWIDLIQYVRSASQPIPEPRLIVVPHEPTAAHLRPLELELERSGLPARRYSEVETRRLDSAAVVVVDRVGILAELYAVADAAYIGGAFGSGVHNLLEPAILGLPLLFGPKHHNAPEAGAFLEAGAASVIRSGPDLAAALILLLNDEERARRGGRARACVEANLGATERVYAHLARALGFDPAPPETLEPSR
jgi:3-deoxy-D-manno-octulosonic-acid transferase